MQEKLAVALQFLKEGQSFLIDDVGMAVSPMGHIEVTGWSQYNNVRYLTKVLALNELNETKKLFSKMLNMSPELKNFVKGKKVHFYLNLDYGMGAATICNEIENTLSWTMAINDV